MKDWFFEARSRIRSTSRSMLNDDTFLTPRAPPSRGVEHALDESSLSFLLCPFERLSEPPRRSLSSSPSGRLLMTEPPEFLRWVRGVANTLCEAVVVAPRSCCDVVVRLYVDVSEGVRCSGCGRLPAEGVLRCMGPVPAGR